MLYEKVENVLLTGDTIFADCYGRTDLKSSSISDMKTSLNKVFDRFQGGTKVYPGHGKDASLKEAKARISIILAFME